MVLVDTSCWRRPAEHICAFMAQLRTNIVYSRVSWEQQRCVKVFILGQAPDALQRKAFVDVTDAIILFCDPAALMSLYVCMYSERE